MLEMNPSTALWNIEVKMSPGKSGSPSSFRAASMHSSTYPMKQHRSHSDCQSPRERRTALDLPPRFVAISWRSKTLEINRTCLLEFILRISTQRWQARTAGSLEHPPSIQRPSRRIWLLKAAGIQHYKTDRNILNEIGSCILCHQHTSSYPCNPKLPEYVFDISAWRFKLEQVQMLLQEIPCFWADTNLSQVLARPLESVGTGS